MNTLKTYKLGWQTAVYSRHTPDSVILVSDPNDKRVNILSFVSLEVVTIYLPYDGS